MSTPVTERLGSGRLIETSALPSTTTTSAHELNTVDGARVNGILRVVPGATTVAVLMHPRQDFSHHVLLPELLSRGYAVWTQNTRTGLNDLTLLHEQALLDMAAGHEFLRSKGFERVISVGHSGGGALAAYYIEQASLPAEQRFTHTPGGKAVPLGEATMPVPDSLMLLAPHPGQGELLRRMIDPSVADERTRFRSFPRWIPTAPTTAFGPHPRARSTPPSSSTPTGRPSAGASNALTQWPWGGSNRPDWRVSATPRDPTRVIAARRWPPGSSRCTAPTLTCTESICRWTPTTGPTDRCSTAAAGPDQLRHRGFRPVDHARCLVVDLVGESQQGRTAALRARRRGAHAAGGVHRRPGLLSRRCQGDRRGLRL